jgi:predicted site-specific integrase-resolvase
MTLRRWETEGRIDPPIRTQGGRRRYDLSKLRAIAPHKAPSTRTTIVYARVSTNGQKDDLVRQVALLESYCATNGWVYEIISDVGSGLNYHKRGLKTLVARICSGDVGRLVLSHKDRLLRFGSELVFPICEGLSMERTQVSCQSPDDLTHTTHVCNACCAVIA